MPYGAPTASAMNREQELGALKDQAGYLEETLENLRKRIEELETTK
jgi:prefoldin subunit 5